MKTVPLAVVEPNGIFLEGLKRIFSKSQFRISCECKSVAELWEMIPPDEELAALLIETDDEAMLSEGDIDRLRETFPDAKIILMSGPARCRKVMRIGEGADGLVLRSFTPDVLVKALELIVLGERMFPVAAWAPTTGSVQQPETAPVIREALPQTLDSLSEREVEVMHLLCKGSPNKIIARQLGISEATVKVHIKAILRKTQARNRTEAALLMSSFLRTGAGSR